MIKDVFTWLDGSVSDEIRMSAALDIVRQFEGHATGLFFSVLPPPPAPIEGDLTGALGIAALMDQARASGDKMEKTIVDRLKRYGVAIELRRFDVLRSDIADVAAREARCADAFVLIRPNGSQDPDRLVEGILFGSGRHILLVPEVERPKSIVFNRILVAWNASRESTRAVAEAMPYLRIAKDVSVVMVTEEPRKQMEGSVGDAIKKHLKHHGVAAELHRVKCRNGNVGETLLAEAKKARSDLIVLGGYGHTRLREMLLGGVTYHLMHNSPVPLLMAH
ncbi:MULTISPECIES: universal stress protein [Hyphomicrobiales]|jgi:nucleotide-binding universal stress UspA family protein|nr:MULTISPECIES: universal stress protein [Hyphomicrobiales]NPU25233.1 universal stress protein [Bradyrhizobium sp. LMG 8443]